MRALSTWAILGRGVGSPIAFRIAHRPSHAAVTRTRNLLVRVVSNVKGRPTMRRVIFVCLLVVLAAPPARAQVEVDVRLEKARYLAGEPIVVLVEVRNAGDDTVEYSTCDRDVR